MAPNPCSDELAIRELAARYSDAVNRHSVEGMVDVYAADGVLIAFGALPVVGHAALGTLFAKVATDHQWIFQMTHSGIVRIEGDQARCRWWVSENALRKDGSGTQFMGSYEDDVIRSADGWKFARRLLQPVYLGRQNFSGKTYPIDTYAEF